MAGVQTFPVAVADQPRKDGGAAAGSSSLTAAEIKSWVREILDWIVKLLPVIAMVLVAIVAEHYKASLTGSTLLSEREKADSQLRSEMFSKLVDPISGARSGADVAPEREQLLAELLALNFHEHIGLKPLLTHVDARLARESKDIDKAKAEAARSARQSFRSVARTVISRQTAMLTLSNGDGSKDDSAQIQKLDIGRSNLDAKLAATLQQKNDLVKRFDEPIDVGNPAATRCLSLTVSQPDWKSETFHVDVSIYAPKPRALKLGALIPDALKLVALKLGALKPDAPKSCEGVELAKRDFELSWFDFPLTDNTLLGDGTRFAIVLDQIYDTNDGRLEGSKPEQMTTDATRRVKLSIVWFPKDYIAAHERPTNYREFRRSLGFDAR